MEQVRIKLSSVAFVGPYCLLTAMVVDGCLKKEMVLRLNNKEKTIHQLGVNKTFVDQVDRGEEAMIMLNDTSKKEFGYGEGDEVFFERPSQKSKNTGLWVRLFGSERR